MAGKLNRAAEIDNLMGAPGFWDNPQKAQGLVDERRRLTAQVKPLQELVAAADDLSVLMEFAEEDETSAQELATTVDSLGERLSQVELQTTLSAPEDISGAYLSVQAGEGGTDASDFAGMLLRMYQIGRAHV